MSAPAANPLVRDTGTPPIPEAKAWLARYGGGHGPAIDVSQAVPGEPPVPDLLAALSRAAASPEAAKYGAILGDADLRAVYAAHASAVYGAAITPGEVAITAGCNLAFVTVAMALAKAGEAMLLPAPWYFNHEMTLRMLGVEARPLPCRIAAGYVPDPAEAERLIDDRVRAVVLVSPNNPTGAVYPPAVLAAFAELCARRGLWLVLDETYRDFLAPEAGPPHALFQSPRARANLISLYSFSKAYGIPGHRLGAMILPERLMPEIGKVLDCLQISAPRVAQMAATWAIPAMGAVRAATRDEIARRAEAFRAAFRGLNGWRIGSIGAYFAFVEHPFADVPAPIVAERLAVERGVLALPGGYFGPGQDRALRFAVANVGTEAIAALPERLAGFSV